MVIVTAPSVWLKTAVGVGLAGADEEGMFAAVRLAGVKVCELMSLPLA